ncbi:GrpB family protein [Candidatus Bathyarchaeota archaeon]|nr:GrpB family protein [Candidatus Bathyarchaeota archaeon]
MEDLVGTVVLVDYDPLWPLLYEEERAQILDAVGEIVLAVEHIGSTAIPGMVAKPIIDLMAGVKGLREAEMCITPLRGLGYLDVTPLPGGPEIYEWYYCLGKGVHSVGYHLHLVRYGGRHWEDHIIFREYLRSHPEVAEDYGRLKRRLATLYGLDRRSYTEGKTCFIEEVISKARNSAKR